MKKQKDTSAGSGDRQGPAVAVSTVWSELFESMNIPLRVSAFLLAALVVCFLWPAKHGFAAPGYTDNGRASWYGTTAHGKQTANGEIYNRYALTAAHKGLPFGTVVRVHNLKNNKHVLVRVNDRGPFVKGRIVDVSLKAAEILKMTQSGVVPVYLEVVGNRKGEPLKNNHGFYVHITDEPGATGARARAAALEKRLKQRVRTLYRYGPALGFLLCLGPYETFDEAQEHFLKLSDTHVSGRGIIVAPVRGEVPVYAPASPLKEKRAATEWEKGSEHLERIWKYITLPHSSASFAVSVFTMEKSFLLFSIVKNAMPRFTNDSDLFRLPYTALSGYIYVPS